MDSVGILLNCLIILIDFMGLSSDYLKLMVFLEFLIISGIYYEQCYKIFS